MPDEHNAFVLDTPEGISAFRHLQVYYALKLEVKCPGLRHSKGSIMNLARERYGITKRTKAGVLADLHEILVNAGVLSV